MKKTLLAWALASVAYTASAQFQFTDDIRLACPKVSDQQYSGTCWCFSSMSFLESEMMFFGNPNPPNLSEMFVVRQNYIDRTQKYVMLHGKMNYGQGSYFLDNFVIAREHGLVPESAMPNTRTSDFRIDHSKLEKWATAFADSVADDSKKKINPIWSKNFEEKLDRYFAPVPQEFEYQGRKYTPRTFADEVVKLPFDDYVQVTSFSHHPYYQNFVLEIPDNWRWENFYNVKIDELTAVIDTALAHGHTVLWASDVSENGFDTRSGYAVLPGMPYPEDPRKNPNIKKGDLKAAIATYNKRLANLEEFKKMDLESQLKQARDLDSPGVEIAINQELRQLDFLNRNTTDDHGMHLIGSAHDQYGNKFYIVKNSWGTVGPYKGYLYASEAFVKAKTTGILVHKSAVEFLMKASEK